MPEALAISSHLCQETFTGNNLTRKRVIDIVVLPLDWGGTELLKSWIIVIFFLGLRLFLFDSF